MIILSNIYGSSHQPWMSRYLGESVDEKEGLWHYRDWLTDRYTNGQNVNIWWIVFSGRCSFLELDSSTRYHIVSTLGGTSWFHSSHTTEPGIPRMTSEYSECGHEPLSGHAGAISGSQDPVGLEDSLTTAEGKAGGSCCLVFSRSLYPT